MNCEDKARLAFVRNHPHWAANLKKYLNSRPIEELGWVPNEISYINDNRISIDKSIAIVREREELQARFPGVVSAYIVDAARTRRLADEFEANILTVSRWARGITYPVFSIQRLVIEWIDKENQSLEKAEPSTTDSDRG